MRVVRITSFAAGVLFAVAVTALNLLGCRVMGNDVVKARVLFSTSNEERSLTNLTVVVGSDKYSWETLRAGVEKHINLLPGPRDDRQLLFSYTFEGQERHWDGPKFELGTGYEMAITIDQEGKVSARHCILPCNLERSSAQPYH